MFQILFVWQLRNFHCRLYGLKYSSEELSCVLVRKMIILSFDLNCFDFAIVEFLSGKLVLLRFIPNQKLKLLVFDSILKLNC